MDTISAINKDFDDFIDPLFEREGGYSNRAADRGGPTNLGVTQATFTDWLHKHARPWRSVRTIKVLEAKQIYFEEYWSPAKCAVLPPKLREIQFDSAVNHGPFRAIVLLQAACGTTQDGLFGSMTLKAALSMDEDLLLARYVVMRYRFYAQIVRKDRSQLANLVGWLNRMEHFG